MEIKATVLSLDPVQTPLKDRLLNSGGTLTAKPIDAATAQAFKNATTPATVYHPSTPPSTTSPLLVADIEYIGSTSQAANYPQMAEQYDSAYLSLKNAFSQFKAGLDLLDPVLAQKDFGLTVDAEGKLILLNSSGSLNATDIERLNEMFKSSDALKGAASRYMNASIDLVKADAAWGGNFMGRFDLNKNNFASTIDIAALFKTTSGVSSMEGWFSSQLWAKGVVAIGPATTV